MMDRIFDRSLAGEITREDAIRLVDSNPFELFETADRLRKEINGDVVTFVTNRLVNYTDQCMVGCHFCSFRNSIGYRMTTEQVLESVREAVDTGATEVCLITGIMPYMDVDFYCDLFKAVKSKYDIMIHGLSPMEVYLAAKASNVTPKEALKAFKDAGLDTMTGAAAEILVDDIRAKICPNKVSTAEWVDIIKDAHEVGFKTTSTIMYGTLETWEDRIDHMFILRDIQRETGGFTEFVPLSFMHMNNRLSDQSMGASGMDDLKLHALSRIIFGNDIPNIQVSWPKLGIKLSQVVLNCGANDFGGTMMEDKITVAGGAKHGEYLSKEEIKRIIEQIGRTPRERNTVYEYV